MEHEKNEDSGAIRKEQKAQQGYKVLSGRGTQDLENEVNKAMKAGARPIGGVIFSAPYFYQAIVFGEDIHGRA